VIDLHSTWLNVSRLSKTIWRIEDAGVSEYLITGNDRSLLIDCGWGIGDLAKTVAGLTSLPLAIINTHGHRDHTSGDYLFKERIHIHEGDVPLLKKAYDPAARTETLRRFPKERWPPGFKEDAWIHAPLPHFESFEGPRSFDLGGRIVDVIETPGHTPGSLCLYDRKERLLFAGDNIQAGNVLMMMPESLPLATYQKSIDKLAAMADKIDKVFPAHGPAPIKPDAFKDMQTGVGKILKGEIRGTPETTYLGSGLALRFDGCGILYKEDRLR
jgi:glyoxylase-like metal-dependent hydrolase (beta-lactamase superfamily II)